MRVGCTGHQKLDGAQDWKWVEDLMWQQIGSIDAPIGVTSLAVGADQLFAKLIINQGGPIYAVIPFADYERTFEGQNLLTYQNLFEEAETVEILEGEKTDEESYLVAGKRVVELSDLLIAVWNGLPAKGKGGTADIVAHAMKHSRPLIHINPSDRSVHRHGC